MKKTIFVLVMVTLLLSVSLVGMWAEPIIPSATSAPATQPVSTEQPEGVTIPMSIVYGIMIGAVVLGASAGYYYARKRK